MGFQFFLVGLGGAIGSMGRAMVGTCFCNHSHLGLRLWLNVIGAFLIGFLVRAMEGMSDPDFFRAFWILGVCGGFTTFSAFGLDLFNLMEDEGFHSLAYLTLSLRGYDFRSVPRISGFHRFERLAASPLAIRRPL